MGNCKDRRFPCLTISACDVVRERAWVGMKGGGEGSTRVAEEVVEAAEGVEEAGLPESCWEGRWSAPDVFSCRRGRDVDRLRVIVLVRSVRSWVWAPGMVSIAVISCSFAMVQTSDESLRRRDRRMRISAAVVGWLPLSSRYSARKAAETLTSLKQRFAERSTHENQLLTRGGLAVQEPIPEGLWKLACRSYSSGRVDLIKIADGHTAAAGP